MIMELLPIKKSFSQESMPCTSPHAYGEIHDFQKEYDKRREVDLNNMGYLVVRYKNHDVLYNWDVVRKNLEKICNNR